MCICLFTFDKLHTPTAATTSFVVAAVAFFLMLKFVIPSIDRFPTPALQSHPNYTYSYRNQCAAGAD